MLFWFKNAFTEWIHSDEWVNASARMCSFRWTLIRSYPYISRQIVSEFDWILSIFSHLVPVYRYLSENRNWFDIPKQNTCTLNYTHDDVPSAPLSKFENICSGECDTHLHCYCYSLKRCHCTGYVVRYKRTFFMNPPTWILFF